MRRLLWLASAMIFFDVAFFAAIAPLLPDYVDQLGLSKAEAGILSASYAAGTLLASLPAGFVASRVGPRRTVICGLLLLGVSSLVFGLVEEIDLLDAARFTQGIAGALIWAGALTWLITACPGGEPRAGDRHRPRHRGRRRPARARRWARWPASVGTELVFGSVLVVSLALAFAASRLPEARVPERQSLREVVATLLSKPILDGAVFVAVPSVMFGAIEVLVPLRIDSLGGGHGVIAAGFIAGAALEATLAPMAGRALRPGRAAACPTSSG